MAAVGNEGRPTTPPRPGSRLTSGSTAAPSRVTMSSGNNIFGNTAGMFGEGWRNPLPPLSPERREEIAGRYEGLTPYPIHPSQYAGVTAMNPNAYVRPGDSDMAELDFYNLDPNYQEFLTAMAKAQGGRSGKALWDRAVEYAEGIYGSGGGRITPFDVVQSWARRAGLNVPSAGNASGYRDGSDATGVDAGYDGPITSRSTSSSVDVTNAEDAEVNLRNAMQSLLGRDPTDKEVSQFTAKLNAAERANPNVTTSSQTQEFGDRGDGPDGGYTQSSSESTGGVNPSLRAQDYAERRPDYAEYQMATTYLDAFRSLIRGA